MRTYKIKCNCKHDFQDQRYGKQIRIANPTQKATTDKNLVVRCTVCSTLHTVNK